MYLYYYLSNQRGCLTWKLAGAARNYANATKMRVSWGDSSTMEMLVEILWREKERKCFIKDVKIKEVNKIKLKGKVICINLPVFLHF
jgi:hypothetical protein